MTPRESEHSNGSDNMELIGENEDVICCSLQEMGPLKLDIEPHESKIKSLEEPNLELLLSGKPEGKRHYIV